MDYRGDNYYISCIDGSAGLQSLEDRTVKLLYGSPPYPNAKRNYGNWSSENYIEKISPFIDSAIPKLMDDGFIAINVKSNRDTHTSGCTTRSLVVEKFAILLEEQWHLHCVDIELWIKTNPVPTGLRVACQDCYEQILWFSKSPKWHINLDEIRRPYSEVTSKMYSNYEYKPRKNGLSYVSKNKTMSLNEKGALPINVISGAVASNRTQHQAVQPTYLSKKYILACTEPGDLIVDPWIGSGTTGKVALSLGRNFVGFDINPNCYEIAKEELLRWTNDNQN